MRTAIFGNPAAANQLWPANSRQRTFQIASNIDRNCMRFVRKRVAKVEMTQSIMRTKGCDVPVLLQLLPRIAKCGKIKAT